MTDQIDGVITVTVEDEERSYFYDDVGLTFDSPDSEILSTLSSIVREDTGVDISNSYAVKKVQSSQNTYVFPKSPAGTDTEQKTILRDIRSLLQKQNAILIMLIKNQINDEEKDVLEETLKAIDGQ